jgi:hypothetical protein
MEPLIQQPHSQFIALDRNNNVGLSIMNYTKILKINNNNNNNNNKNNNNKCIAKLSG